MWRIIHLIAGTKSGIDAIATKGEANFDVGSPFLSCLVCGQVPRSGTADRR